MVINVTRQNHIYHSGAEISKYGKFPNSTNSNTSSKHLQGQVFKYSSYWQVYVLYNGECN